MTSAGRYLPRKRRLSSKAMTRGWDNLSDFEFECLVADLLGADLSLRV
jgi:hypothetical protein